MREQVFSTELIKYIVVGVIAGIIASVWRGTDALNVVQFVILVYIAKQVDKLVEQSSN